ncbi:MAG: chromate transporter [Candidatus Omnitrophica bacterium]|nr:chromate transporter [Candidatus Omnitrophota bacterium]
MTLLNLFFSFFRTGLFATGGAYSFLPLIEKEVVERYNWLTQKEFLDILGIVNVFPGAISIKYATYTGYKIGGIPGAVIANIGNLLAPALLILLAASLYIRYKENPFVAGAFRVIELVIFAMIIAVAFQTVNVSQLLKFRSIIVVAVSLGLFLYTKIHPALIIVFGGLIGAFLKWQ